MTEAASGRTPGVAQQARDRASVVYHPTVHVHPFQAGERVDFEVGDTPCSVWLRNWRDRPSYDPASLDMPDGVVIDEVTPDWSDTIYSTTREILFSGRDGDYTSVRWRLDW